MTRHLSKAAVKLLFEIFLEFENPPFMEKLEAFQVTDTQ